MKDVKCSLLEVNSLAKGRVRLRETVEREAKGDPAVFCYCMGGCTEDKARLYSGAYEVV